MTCNCDNGIHPLERRWCDCHQGLAARVALARRCRRVGPGRPAEEPITPEMQRERQEADRLMREAQGSEVSYEPARD